MKHQMVITFEIPDGTPADAINRMEGEVRELLDGNVGVGEYGIAWTSEAEPTYCQNLAHT